MVNIIVLQKAQVVELLGNLKRPGSVVDQPTPVRRRNARLDKNIAAVRENVSENPNLAIPHRAQELRLSQTSTWRILIKDLGLFPYKIQLTQELNPNDHLQRRQFADWALEQLKIDPNFGKNNHLYRRSPFLVKWLRKQAKLSHLG